ncbi:MAG: peptidyl-prolyl cis-trans isomerase [Deltaproteobacteria bacterium]|nr:peptidyl-prolyl cis-trans isomerase [Deltaproteobacteria bacterium]
MSLLSRARLSPLGLGLGCIAGLLAVGGFSACSRPTTAPAPVAAAASPQALPAAATPTQAPPEGESAAPFRAVAPVATVNGKPISAEKFNAELDKLIGPGAKIPTDRLRRIAHSIIGRLVENELREQAIAQNNIEVTQAELDEVWSDYTRRFADENGKVDEAGLASELKRTRRSIAEVKEQLRQQKLGQKLTEKLGKVDVSEAEMKQFFDGNPTSFVEQASRDVRAIVVRVAADAQPSERDKAAQRAKNAYEALKKGQDFELVAKEFGDGAQPPLHILKGSTDSDLEKVAFEMKVGDIAPPIRTRWGYYVIRLIEKNDQRNKTYGEVREEIRRSLLSRKAFLEERRIVQELRRKADVIEKLPF